MALRALLTLFAVIIGVIFLLSKFPSLLLASVLGVVTVFIFLKMTRGLAKEIVVTGTPLAFLGAYHFYLQPGRPDVLPVIAGPVLWYFGVVIVVRATVFFGTAIPVPVVSHFARLMGSD